MKNKHLKSIGILFFFGILTINAYSQSDSELKTKIEKINKEIAKAMVEGKSDVSLSYYVADAISLPNYGKLADGIEAIKKSNQAMMESGMKVTAFETTILKLIKNENLITEIGTYKFTFTMTGMETPMDDFGKYITIWEKQKDGSLKIKVEMWNTDNYPAGQM